MKKIFNILFVMLIAMNLHSCDDWTEMETKNFEPEPLSEEYYAALREYKKSDHALAFGWFGSWSPQGAASLYYSLKSVPDSVDIVSIWGSYGSLTQFQKDDLKYVQEVLGTRVTFTLFSHNMANLPGNFENVAENIPKAAKAIADSIHKYGYDGIDFDHECTSKDLLYKEENMTALLREMRELLGPDKLIIVDGFVDLISEEGWKYANYAVSQAYGATSATRLKQRFDWIKEYIGPERYIVTENFESWAATGGVTFRDPERGEMPSLLGMAYWNPAEGRKGGLGTFHMEYEFSNNYKYLRQAIQIMNPAKK